MEKTSNAYLNGNTFMYKDYSLDRIIFREIESEVLKARYNILKAIEESLLEKYKSCNTAEELCGELVEYIRQSEITVLGQLREL